VHEHYLDHAAAFTRFAITWLSMVLSMIEQAADAQGLINKNASARTLQ
jgi:hypothetical protein